MARLRGEADAVTELPSHLHRSCAAVELSVVEVDYCDMSMQRNGRCRVQIWIQSGASEIDLS
eukprot:4844505-Prymnesium_polylepis.1